MGPGTGQGAPSRTTPMDTLRQLAGDVSEFLTSRADMVRNTPGYQPTAATGRERLDQIANRSSEELRALYDQVWSNPAFGPLVMGIKAFHGSPHDFDKFDLSKIGTGEGAQAYGHGLYFAENEAVARGYRDALSAPEYPTTAIDKSPDGKGWSVYDFDAGDYGKPAEVGRFATRAEAEDHLDDLFARVEAQTPPGRMYEVDIRTTPNRLIDWDKPISEQSPEVQAALKSLGVAAKRGVTTYKRPSPDEWARLVKERYGVDDPMKLPEDVLFSEEVDRLGSVPVKTNYDPTGQQAFEEIAGGDANYSEEASAALRNAGIDGIRYLDAGSRGAGDGTKNYVIFDADLINILRKYGILAPLMGAGAVEAVSGAPEQ